MLNSNNQLHIQRKRLALKGEVLHGHKHRQVRSRLCQSLIQGGPPPMHTYQIEVFPPQFVNAFTHFSTPSTPLFSLRTLELNPFRPPQ